MDKMLSNEQIFSTAYFSDEGFDRPRWCKDGSKYTTLRKISIENSVNALINSGHSDLTATTTSISTIVNSTVYEIIIHDAEDNSSEVLVAYQDLIPKNDAKPIVIDDYVLSKDMKKILIQTNAQKVWRLKTRGSYWIFDLIANQPDLNRLRSIGGSNDLNSLMFATFSPDSSRVAYVKFHNIYIEDLTTHVISQLTMDGNQYIINGTFDWVYEEEFHLRNGFRWSNDSTKIAFWRLDQTDVPVVHLINNTDTMYPTLIPIHYPKTGQDNAKVKIGIASTIEIGLIEWLDLPVSHLDHYLADMEYNEHTGELILQRLNREQNQLKVLSWYDNQTKTLYEDDDEAWIDISHHLKWIHQGTKFFYLSDKNSYRQILMVSCSDTGSVTEISPRDLEVIEYVGSNEMVGYVYYLASTADTNLEKYLYSSSFEGSNHSRITPSTDEYKGANSYQVSADGRFAVHSFSCIERPAITSIVNLPDHQVLIRLASNDVLYERVKAIDNVVFEFFKTDITSLIHQRVTEVSATKAVESKSEDYILDCWCLYPPNFDENLKYPVIFHVYGEPAANIVLNQFGGRIDLWHRMLAQRGAIVMCIENRGVPAPRGRSFRKCVYGKIGQLASSDQACAVKKILENRTYIDKSRVAVWGWSGGGSMSLNALFRYPDVYQAAVSVAPVPDMQLYDTIYQERYMNLPQANSIGYHKGSPVNFVESMKSTQSLLVIHGTGDDNCHYQGTERLINELIKGNKPFQMMAYPNRSHSISEGPNTTRHLFELITRFFKENTYIDY